MCSISVEPRPSRISTPKCSVQRLPMSAGSASPADVQRRSLQLAALRQVGAREQRGEERRHAVEDRRLVLAQAREDGGGRRALGHQHRRRADRQRKRERVAEPVGEEELRRREHDVVLADAEDRLRVELGRLDQARVHVHRALGRAGRARRIEPEAHVVAGRRARQRSSAPPVHQPASSEWCPAVACSSVAPETITCLRCGQSCRAAARRRGSSGAETTSARGAAVAQHVLVVAGRQQRVRRRSARCRP